MRKGCLNVHRDSVGGYRHKERRDELLEIMYVGKTPLFPFFLVINSSPSNYDIGTSILIGTCTKFQMENVDEYK